MLQYLLVFFFFIWFLTCVLVSFPPKFKGSRSTSSSPSETSTRSRSATAAPLPAQASQPYKVHVGIPQTPPKVNPPQQSARSGNRNTELASQQKPPPPATEAPEDVKKALHFYVINEQPNQDFPQLSKSASSMVPKAAQHNESIVLKKQNTANEDILRNVSRVDNEQMRFHGNAESGYAGCVECTQKAKNTHGIDQGRTRGEYNTPGLAYHTSLDQTTRRPARHAREEPPANTAWQQESASWNQSSHSMRTATQKELSSNTKAASYHRNKELRSVLKKRKCHCCGESKVQQVVVIVDDTVPRK